MRVVFNNVVEEGQDSRNSRGLEGFLTHKDALKHVVCVEVREGGWLSPGNMKRINFDEIIEDGLSMYDGHCQGEFSACKDTSKHVEGGRV